MATVNAADYLGRSGVMDAIEPGCHGDFVVLHANPLETVGNLHDIAAVVRAGVFYSRQALDEMKAQVASARGYL